MVTITQVNPLKLDTESTFVLMAGLPGTGKSTLATALAKATSSIILSKDAIRATLFPGTLTDYSEEQDDLCFKALLDAATYIAQHSHSEIAYLFLDGRTFRKRSQIESAIQAAESAGCRWRILHLTCPDDIAIGRLASDDRAGRHVARNRNEHLYQESKGRFEVIDYPVLGVDTSASLEECLQLCLPYLAPSLPGVAGGA